VPECYRSTSPIRNSAPLEPFSRTMPRALWQPFGGRPSLMSEVPLYAATAPAAAEEACTHTHIRIHTLTHSLTLSLTLSLSRTHTHAREKALKRRSLAPLMCQHAHSRNPYPSTLLPKPCKGTSLMRKRLPSGPYTSPMPGAVRWS